MKLAYPDLAGGVIAVATELDVDRGSPEVRCHGIVTEGESSQYDGCELVEETSTPRTLKQT